MLHPKLELIALLLGGYVKISNSVGEKNDPCMLSEPLPQNLNELKLLNVMESLNSPLPGALARTGFVLERIEVLFTYVYSCEL